jgi:phage tail-like protein
VSRGLVSGLAVPKPLIGTLPGLYQTDLLAESLTRAFDDVIAPIVATLDNFDSYLDPALTPEDFLDWLAGWVGLLPDETWPIERRRALVAVAADLYRSRGTAGGLAMHVKLLTAGDVEVADSGGSVWSTSAGTAAPGDGSYSVTVKVKPPKKGGVEKARIEALVAAAKPAHVTHQVEIAQSGS